MVKVLRLRLPARVPGAKVIGLGMFQLGGVLVSLLNLWAWLRLRRWLARAKAPRALVGSSAVVFLAVLFPALTLAVGSWSGLRRVQSLVPEWWILVAMGAQIGVLLALLASGLGAASARLYRGVVRAVRRGPHAAGAAEADDPDFGRRRLLVSSAVLPVLAVGMSGVGVAAARQAPAVVRVPLPVRRSFTSLHGVTLAQVSDVHIGSYMDAERLDEIQGAMNAPGADYHVITGDLLDNDVSQLELAARFIRGLKPRRGEVYFSMGNHEYIAARRAGTRTIVDGIAESGCHVLLDEARAIRVGGDHFWLGGIDYPRRGRFRDPPGPTTEESLTRMLAHVRDDGAPRIVLSHHPRTFVQAREYPIDLMLSGHTHGGQIHLGRIGDYALTPILPVEFYHNGLYEHGGRRLYVNAGAGGWLPVRINYPPEITLVEMVGHVS